AREIVQKEKPDLKIVVIDSSTAAAAEGFIALAAARTADAGATLDEAVKAALSIKEKVNIYVLLDTIRHVYRSGRIPKVAAQAGSLLNIRPVFHVRGKVHLSGVVRSRERGIATMFEKVQTQAGGKPIHAAVMHVHAPEAATELTDRVSRTFNCVELWQSDFSPLMGYACGTGTLALAYYPEVPDGGK
ncbi:MAG: DegV family protein, partial [Dehalococcoidia bacterium]|nr:DegV family protein [Dehalococcoidia bacterium]